MKTPIAILSILALSACMGSGDDGEDLTPTTPSTTMNAEFGTGLNALRMNSGANSVFYDATVGRAAQIHANDMYTNDHLSIFLGDDPTANDMGDTLNDLGLSWNEIGQYIAQGDYDTDTVLTEWETNGSQGDGDDADKLTFTNMDLFGIAKAGSGTDSRWVLLLVDN